MQEFPVAEPGAESGLRPVGPGDGSLEDGLAAEGSMAVEGGRGSRYEHAARRRPAVRVALTGAAPQRRRGVGSRVPPDNGLRRRRQRHSVGRRRLCPAAGAAHTHLGRGESDGAGANGANDSYLFHSLCAARGAAA